MPCMGWVAAIAGVSGLVGGYVLDALIADSAFDRVVALVRRPLDRKAAKLLQKYDLNVEDVWQGSQVVRKRMEAHSVPKGLAESFERSQKLLDEMMQDLGKQIEKLDPTLVGALENARTKISFQIENLRLKAGRALDERNHVIAEHERYLESLLYPNKALQSRELCLLPLLARWGAEGMRELQQHCSGAKLGHDFVMRIP